MIRVIINGKTCKIDIYKPLKLIDFCFFLFAGEANDDQPFVGGNDRGDNTNNNLYLYNVSKYCVVAS